MITPYAQWPKWLQILVLGPNILLALVWVWLTLFKKDEELQRLGFGFKRMAIFFAYLAAFYLVMHLVFHWG